MDVIGCVYLMCFRFLAFQVLFPWGVPEHLTLGPPPRGRIASYLGGNYGLFSILGSRGAWGVLSQSNSNFGRGFGFFICDGESQSTLRSCRPPRGRIGLISNGELWFVFHFSFPRELGKLLFFCGTVQSTTLKIHHRISHP